MAGPQGVKGMPGPTGKRGGLKMSDSQIQAKIRLSVRQILDRLLPENNAARACGNQCMSYSEYAKKVFNTIVEVFPVTEIEPVTDAPYVPYEPETDAPYEPYVPPATDAPYVPPATEEIATEAPVIIIEPTTETDYTATEEPEEYEDDEDDYDAYLDLVDDYEDGNVNIIEQPTASGQAVDLVFLIETSDYMLNLDWDLVTAWVKRVITVAKSDPSKNVESCIVIIRFNHSRHTMASILEQRIDRMKQELMEDAIVQHVVSDTFEALDYANSVVYNNLRHGSKRVLITITDGSHREFNESGHVSDANAAVLANTMAKYPVMIAIGLGSDVDAKQLSAFASHDDKVFVDVTANRLDEITLAVLAEVEFYEEPRK
jgi:hypothetical protein